MTSLGLLLGNTPNFIYGKFSNLSKNFLFPSSLRCKVTTIFHSLQIFLIILSKFEVNNLYKYFYGIINFVQLSNLIYKKLYLYIYIIFNKILLNIL